MIDLQQRVQATLDTLTADGAERGLQVVVFQHGELLVDAVAGTTDPATGAPVTPGSIFYTWSMGKVMTATALHQQVDRGLFGYDTRIAEIWPEFAANGKESATVRHALTHTLGVPGLPADVTPEEVCDWDRVCARIAGLPPLWEPGTRSGYHAYTFGYILGEVIRRATGRSLAEILREDIARPLGYADELYFGVPEDQLHRVAPLEDAPGSAEWLAALPDDDPFFSLAPRAVTPTARFGNRRDVLMADIPAGGKMSARAVATLYAALLGDIDGVELLSAERRREATAVAYAGTDELFDMPVTRGLGFDLGDFDGGRPTRFAWGGVGGGYAFGDTSTGIAFALTKNRLAPDFDTARKVIALVDQHTGLRPG